MKTNKIIFTGTKKILFLLILVFFIFCSIESTALATEQSTQNFSNKINVSPILPDDILGGAESADLKEAAIFAWQEFIALNWPAIHQNGEVGSRDTYDENNYFGDESEPLVWETFRSEVEYLPGEGYPNGYQSNEETSFGYDSLPDYIYSSKSEIKFPNKDGVGDFFEGVGNYEPQLQSGRVPACELSKSKELTPWINLDENDQILTTEFFSGNGEGGDFPARQFLYMAKANRQEYTYLAKNGWIWDETKKIPSKETSKYVSQKRRYPSSGNTKYISFPDGTIRIKAAWRRLTEAEMKSGRFHVAPVRYYQKQDPRKKYAGKNGYSEYPCYQQEYWGLVALHIVHKTPSAPYFTYATFDQIDSILDVEGNQVEDVNGRLLINQTSIPTEPEIVSIDAKQSSAPDANSIQNLIPRRAESDPGKRLYYRNVPSFVNAWPRGTFSVNRRNHNIPEQIINVNEIAHEAIKEYNNQKNISSSPWQYYKLVNIQWKPIDKPTYGHPFPSNDMASTYYLSSILIETSFNWQNFSGTFQYPLEGMKGIRLDGLITDYDSFGLPYKNVVHKENSFNMGGCMGCHGVFANAGFDFDITLYSGRVNRPDSGDQPMKVKLDKNISIESEHKDLNSKTVRSFNEDIDTEELSKSDVVNLRSLEFLKKHL